MSNGYKFSAKKLQASLHGVGFYGVSGVVFAKAFLIESCDVVGESTLSLGPIFRFFRLMVRIIRYMSFSKMIRQVRCVA